MNGDEETEALRRAFTAPGGIPPHPESCPAPETLWAAVHGELPPGALRDVVDHIASCPACAEDWRLAVEAEREATPADHGDLSDRALAPVLRSRRWGGLTPYLSAAAAIVLVVIGLQLGRHPDQPLLRGQKPVVSLLKEGQALPRNHCLLVWSGPEKATYDVEVHTLIGQQLALAHGLTATQYLVPESSLAAIPPGTRLEWQVTATVPGEAARRSKASTFILR
jgi:hypothetical protein